MKVSIINSSLARLPQELEVASEGDTSPIARKAFMAFDSVFRDLSARTDWSFLRKDIRLVNATKLAESDFYEYSYVVPPDFERVLEVRGSDEEEFGNTYLRADRFNRDRVRNFYYSDKRVFTNFNPAFMTYIIRAEDALSAANGSFITALELGIASIMANIGSGSVQLSSYFSRQYEQQIRLATNVNVFEKNETDLASGGVGGSRF